MLAAFAIITSSAVAREEPGNAFVGATFTQVVKGVTYEGKVVSYTPPQTNAQHLTEIETKGLYKVVYDDGDFAQLYYEDLMRHGATLATGEKAGSEL